MKIIWLIRNWKLVLIAGLGSLLLTICCMNFLVYGMMSMITAPLDFFFGEENKELHAKQIESKLEVINAYKQAGEQKNVYWVHLAVYDVLQAQGDLNQLSVQKLAETLEKFTYVIQVCNKEGKCKTETRYYTLQQLLEKEKTDPEDIEYALYLAEQMLGIQDDYLDTVDEKWLAKQLATGKKFLWPVPSTKNITSAFRMRMNPLTGKEELHKGIDISAGKQGVPIVATADGIVIQRCNDPTSSGGRWIHLQHEENIQTRYLHLDRLAIDEQTKQVKKGQIIGFMGSTGESTGVHLHFETRKNGTVFNPLALVSQE